MKKLKVFAIIVITICSLPLLLFAGCGKYALDMPTEIVYDDSNNITWATVSGARGYIIEIKDSSGNVNEETLRKASFSASKLAEGDYEIRVKAIGDTSGKKESPWTEYMAFHKDYSTGCFYELINNGTEYAITSAGTSSGSFTVEDSFKGKPVTQIGRAAFKGSSKIENIVIGNNVNFIGENAFYNCSKLEAITLPDSISFIGAAAFQACKLLKTVNIPKNLTELSENVFAYCISLEKIDLGENLLSIGNYAFTDCSKLAEITIPNSVLQIGLSAFSANAALTTVNVGSGVVNINDSAFYKCESLTKITFAENSSLNAIGSYAFAECTALSTITLPNGLSSIGKYAFRNMVKLESIILPETVKSIGASAFYGTKLHLLAEASGQPFYYADKWLVGTSSTMADTLTSITLTTLKQGVVGIADSVFKGFKVLESVVLPQSLKVIGSAAFYENVKLWKVQTYDDSVETIGSWAFGKCAFLSRVTLGNGLKSIGNNAFNGCTLLDNNALQSSSLVPETVTSIGMDAFKDTALWKNPDASGLIYAGKWVVGYTGTETSVSLNADTIGVGDFAFANSESLSSVINLNSAKYVGAGAFYQCINLATVSLNRNLKTIEPYTFYKCEKLFNISMPPRLTSIGANAFYGCANLNELDLSASLVTYIGNSAFYKCLNLKTIELGDLIETIDYAAFANCTSVKKLSIPDSTKRLGSFAFSGCTQLTDINMGNGMVSIGNNAFQNCQFLIRIILPDTVEYIGNRAFFKCEWLAEVTLGNSLKSIGSYAFYGTMLHNNLTLPESVEYIGDSAFRSSKLDSITLSENIKVVGSNAFYGNNSLTIYAENNSIGGEWNDRWNSLFRPVIWGCELSEDKNYVVSITISKDTISNPNSINGITGPLRKGFKFAGWTTEKGTETIKYGASELADVPMGTTVYAVWTEDKT